MDFSKAPQIDLQTHPLFLKLVNEKGFQIVTPENFEETIKQEGITLLLFIENPNRMKETMDALVIAPELADALPMIENRAVVVPPDARKLSVAYGLKRWPAFVFLKDGGYLGTVGGLRLWSELVQESVAIVQSQPKYPPSIGIQVTASR